MAERLQIEEDCRGTYRIVWVLDGEAGAILGQGGERYTAAQVAKSSSSSVWEHRMATHVLAKAPGVRRNSAGYYWETYATAQIAIRMARAALKNKGLKPWPSWALEAKAHRWAPPKGWTP